MKILITGATGLIGKNLGVELTRIGHELYVVSRNAHKAKTQCPFPHTAIEHDLNSSPIPAQKMPQIDAVINLMGESIAEGRWSEVKKQNLIHSRVQATLNLVASFPKHKPRVFISSSAIGYYGNRKDEVLNEQSLPGEGFLAQLCRQWEEAALTISSSQTRVSIVRTGIVLSRQGGALAEMLPPFLQGVGGKLGDGKQWMSWIHIDDLVRIYMLALQKPELDIINATSPNPMRNEDFTKTLSKAIGTPALLPVPKTALKIAFGEKSCILTDSQNVQPMALVNNNFEFQHVELQTALEQECGVYKKSQIFENQQYLDLPLEKVFDFFSDAKNLESITPDTLNFQIESMSTPQVEKGTKINYRLKIHGVPAKWTTLIEEWRPPYRFVDTQLKGPYSLWHHTHSFERLGTGTLMTDRVLYKLPLGGAGQMAAGWFVKRDVQSIFNFRTKQIDRLLFKGL